MSATAKKVWFVKFRWCEALLNIKKTPDIHKQKVLRKKQILQIRGQMVKRCAHLPRKQDAQKECKKLTVKVKRLNVHKQLCYSKEKELSPCKRHGCETKESEVSGCAHAVALQDQCTSKLSEKATKTKSHTKSFKRAVVRLKRLKFDNTAKLLSTTDLLRESTLSGCSTALNLRGQRSPILCKDPKDSNPQLTSVKKAVVRLKRFQFVSTIRPLTSDYPAKVNVDYQVSAYSNLRRELKESKQPQVTKSVKEPTITIPQKDCKQLKSSKPNKNLKEVQKVTDTKMRTRFQDTISKVYDILPKSRETPSQKTCLSKNVFRKKHGLIADLVMTPEDRSNLSKLSLTKRLSKRKSADDNATKTHEITRFSPERNSTAYGIYEETLSEEKCNEESQNLTKNSGNRSGPKKDSSNSVENQIPKNIANKPDLIEQLLCCDEEQQIHTSKKRNGNESQAKKFGNKTHKFFHRLPETQPQSNKLPAEPENIFEFLSQSDTSEADIGKSKDPAADIIKKLISDGKVRVAVNNKGTGRPIIKRRQPKNQRKKQIKHKNKASKVKGTKKTIASTTNDNILQSEAHHHYDHDDDNGSQNLNDHLGYSATKDLEEAEHVSGGGFSHLARSVLLQQTKKYENTRINALAEKRRLLDVARKFVSTPASNRISENLPTADISPIQALSTQGRPVCPSPWRIDDDLHLPSIFNFTKNASCLPTFSSDYIPPTPKKNKSNNSSQLCNETNLPIEKSAISRQDNSANLPNNITSTDSSGSLQGSGSGNDSNAENLPPIEVTPARNLSNNDKNGEIFSKLPNPRRTLKSRTPLKAINIIEVINLPPWKKPTNSDGQKEINVKAVTLDSNKDDESHYGDGLFGFEEFLDQSSDNGEVSNAANITAVKRTSLKRSLRKKLKELKKWRPKNSVRDTSNISEKPCLVFNENDGRPKQRLIKEMLCSTMINQTNNKRLGKDEKIECNREVGDAQPIETDFFNDYEPEDSFQKKPQRTYGRPVKRKRKGVKNFVMFPDSEESNSDSEEEKNEHRKKVQKKKRHDAHTKPEENPELESFVNEFNSMCQEVENYELLVE